MFRFQVLVLAGLASGVSASLPSIAGYEPKTSVVDHAGIAGDQRVIERLVGIGDETSFAAAEKVYREGGHSKSIAEITLGEGGLTADVAKGAEIIGTSTSDSPVTGAAMDSYPAGTSVIRMQYRISDDSQNYVSCKVGGLPPEDQVTSGCILDVGTVVINGASIAYTAVEHKNGRTIEGFSTDANTRFKFNELATSDYYPFYQKYINYYGSNTFGDEICAAGFDGTETALINGNINLDGYTGEGRSQIAKKGTAYINTALYALRELYDAIDDCKKGCTTEECNDDAVHALDEAVAFYVGNQHETDGLGNLAYALAEKRGANFATMTGADFVSGQSLVNEAIMRQFKILKDQFINKQCAEAESGVAEVLRLMQIPFIQGTLRYAYRTSTSPSPTESAQAEGAIFAAYILPNVAACNSDAANTIYDNMRLRADRSTRADYKLVKEAFESVYECLELSCADVGGLVDEVEGNKYVEGGAPCGNAGVLSAQSGSTTAMMSFAGVVIATIAAFFM